MPTAKATKKPLQATNTKKTRVKKAKQVLSDEDRLKRLFSTLCSQIDGSHFPNAIKTCDKILRIGPNDQDALKTKLFLLLQTERYNEALSLLNEDALREQGAEESYGFEKAYTLYRLQKEQQAKDFLDALPEKENHRGIVHLEAQLNYREGSYEVAIDLYNQLLDTADPNSEEYSDILTNLQASQQHLDFIQSGYLRALDTLPTSLVSSLESSPVPPPPVPHPQTSIHHLGPSVSNIKQQQTQQQQAENKNAGTGAVTATAAKKVRMKRVPAGVVPGVTPPPDPERWLKKTERSSYHANVGKNRGKKGYGAGATQGSVTLDTPIPSSTTTSTSAGAGSKSGKPKKKK